MAATTEEPAPERVGMCALRVWHYGDGLTMRLQMRPDVARPETEQVHLSTDIDATLARVSAFLTAFRDDGG